MSNGTQALTTTRDKPMEFVPYGAQDKIKLTVAIIRNLVAVKTKSGKSCSDEDAIKFMMMCQARRLNPFEGDAYLIGYDGKDGPSFSLITAHQAFLKRAELNPEYDGMKSGIIIERDGQIMDLEGDFFLEGDKLLGGWATVYFKNRKQPMHKRVRLQRFKKPFGIWLEDPAGMICKCAEADALRSSFPTMLGGLYLREELHQDEPKQIKTSTPIFEQAAQIEAPKEPAAPPEDSSLGKIRERLQKADVAESDFIGFLQAIGCIGDADSLEQVALENEGVMPMIEEQLPDMIKKIKEAK